jgi:hypothetical protein
MVVMPSVPLLPPPPPEAAAAMPAVYASVTVTFVATVPNGTCVGLGRGVVPGCCCCTPLPIPLLAPMPKPPALKPRILPLHTAEAVFPGEDAGTLVTNPVL